MADYQFDVLVVGTGPGGEGAAMQAAKDGKNVAVVERHAHIGGGCTHWGTIPSKALRHAIFQFSEMLGNSLLRHWPQRQVTFTELRATAGTVIARQESLRRGFYERNQVPIFRGDACFVDSHTVQVADRTISAAAIVLATGARPYHPEGIDFQNPRIRDSDTILGLDDTPKSITIYGAGVVGTEYASMFRNLNTKVNLVNTRQKLLEFLDDEIIDALSYHLRDCGIIIRHNEQYERIEARDDGVILHLQSGKKLKTDLLLWANGRTGNTDHLGLEKAGLTANQRGQLEVNQNFQTAVPHVYAVGDLIGYPSLASAAYTQGRAAATHIVTGVCEHDWMADIPTGIYTMPEISSVGKTERELTEKKIPYEVGQAQFKSLARAQITGRTVGMLKLLFHRETLQLLGIHCFGENASEIVHIGQAIMAQKGAGNSLLYFMNTTFNYPTMAEAYRVAALNGYNRLF